jgi:1,4-dihydroxy-2-naphthoate octaprenyltransferase
MIKSAKVWLYAARPKTLFIGAAPILFGSLLALKQSTLDLQTFLLCLIGAIAIQIGTNYSNDYYDFLNKADTCQRQGSEKVLEQGLVSPFSMQRAFMYAFFLAVCITLCLINKGGLPFLIIAFFCIFFSIAYTAPPFPLAYLGLGDVFVLIFYGPVATLTCFYLHSHSFCFDHILTGLMPGFLGLGPLIINNIRDVEQDRLANKKTLIVRCGDLFGRYYFMLVLSIGIVLPYAQAFLYDKNPFVFLTTLAYLPVFKNIHLLSNCENRSELQHLFLATAKAVPLFTVLYFLSELLFYVSKLILV